MPTSSPTLSKPSRSQDARARAAVIVHGLRDAYPDASCALNYRTPLELLVATVLSAQCTDQRVNLVTKALFTKYRSAADFARAEPRELENDIRSTGFFRNKAKNIRECCRQLVEQHRGEVPRDIDSLVQLPGIGRKTANVILGTAMGLASGVVVDTHVRRLTNRMGLTRHKDPVKIERVLMSLVPRDDWINFSHRMIAHGRRACSARKPACEDCSLSDVCPKIGVRRKRLLAPNS